MRYLLLPILLLAMDAFPKGKLVQAAGRRDRRPDGEATATAFREIHDSDFIGEMADLYRNAGGMDPDAFLSFSQRGLGAEAQSRCRRNRELRGQIKSLIASENVPEGMRIDLARDYWKLGHDSADFASDEDLLISAHSRSRNPRLRKALLRQITSTRAGTLQYVEGICEGSKDATERSQAAFKLGHLAMLAEAEGHPGTRDEIAARLRKLHAAKRLRLSDLGNARVMGETAEGRDYVKGELRKDGYRDWQAVLWAMKEQIGYEYFRGIYRHFKSAPGSAQEDELGMVARANLGDGQAPAALKKDAEKIEFLEIRTLAGVADSLAKADALAASLLSDKSDAVRFAAVKTVHRCLKNNREMLASLWAYTNTATRIKGRP
jgi:hypothetical protein